MNLPNEDQWDETTCGSAVCQHPQCWTSLRRIERGHPRILDSSSKSSREVEGTLASLWCLLHRVLILFLFGSISAGSRLHVLFWSNLSDKLPSLTIVNIMDTCLWSKQRVVQRPRSEFTFPKERSLLWKPTCRRHGR